MMDVYKDDGQKLKSKNMNKNLNNWFDKVEGLPKNYTNNHIVKELKRQGFTCKMYIDKHGKKFIGWDKTKK